MSWSREQCEILIEQYQRFPCLYDVKSRQYTNKHARRAALETIQNVLRSIKPNVSIADIKAKINGLRTNFLSEYKKWNASKQSGAGENTLGDVAVYEPTIWYFKKLFFILQHVRLRNSIDHIDPLANIEEETQESLGGDTKDFITFSEYIPEEFSVAHDWVSEPVKQSNNRNGTTSSSSSNTDSDKSATHKKCKNNGVSDGDGDLKEEASNALSVISKFINTVGTKDDSDKKHTSKDTNAALATFITEKLDQIVDEDIRLEVEQDITNKLFEAIKESRKRKRH